MEPASGAESRCELPDIEQEAGGQASTADAGESSHATMQGEERAWIIADRLPGTERLESSLFGGQLFLRCDLRGRFMRVLRVRCRPWSCSLTVNSCEKGATV